MSKIIDRVGFTFGHLTVVSFSHLDRRAYWNCICDCGNSVVVRGDNLYGAYKDNCGCKTKENLLGINFKHGLSHTPISVTLKNMISRCENTRSQDYKNYGGRGISVCKEWRNNLKSFAEWAESKGFSRYKNPSIERIDFNGNYCPDNCTIIPNSMQGGNTRRVRILTLDGVSMSLSKWAQLYSIGIPTLYLRLKKGVPLGMALSSNNSLTGKPINNKRHACTI